MPGTRPGMTDLEGRSSLDLTLRFHCAWNVCTSGAGNRDTWSSAARGSQRKRRRTCRGRQAGNRQRHRHRIKLRPPREEAHTASPNAPSRARDAARIRARASGASAWAAECAPGTLPRSGRRRSSVRQMRAFSMPTMLGVSTAPIGPDRPRRRCGRRPPRTPDNGSCRRRSGCSAACRGIARRAWRCGVSRMMT